MPYALCLVNCSFSNIIKPLFFAIGIAITCTFSSCQNFDPPPVGTVPMSIDISLRPFWLGFCEISPEGPEDVAIVIKVSTVDLGNLAINEFSFTEFGSLVDGLENDDISLSGRNFTVRAPTVGIYTVEVTAILSCSSCCGQGPFGGFNGPPDACGTQSGMPIGGQPRFSTEVPNIDAAANAGSTIPVFLEYRNCLTCGCVD